MYKIELDGIKIEFNPNENISILTKMESESLPVIYGCMNGICATCKLTIVEGKENLEEIQEPMLELENNEFLPCCYTLSGNIKLTKK
jgi:ferredoxin